LKESYLREDNIDEVSRRILGDLTVMGLVRKAPPDLKSAALLVIDMQRYFLDRASHAFIPSAAPVLGRIRNLAEAFRASGLPVILTRHVNSPDDSGSMRAWWGEVIEEKDPMSELPAELAGIGEVVRKSQYDAFYGTGLEEKLREKGVRQVVVTGVMTHICCDTTARSAFVRGFEVLVPVDGTATQSLIFHESSLLGLSHCAAAPVLTGDLIRSLKVERDNE
jgi:isochorismate hydrolase